MNLKLLLIGADENNSRDGVIVEGTKRLISRIVQKYDCHYHLLNDHITENDDFFLKNQFTHIIICGTPWLWDQFHVSVKYKNLINILDNQISNKILFCGVGSCIGLQHIDSDLCEDDLHQEGIRNLFLRGTVICRDDLIHKKLEKAGVASNFLPCPSMFFYLNKEIHIKNNENILIWCDPEKLISNCDWNEEEKLNGFYNLCKKFIEMYDSKVYCAEEHDIQKACDIGLPKPILLKTWKETLHLMSYANYVLSGRVHCAVPAFVLGKPTSIIPFDSRHKVLSDFGCPVSVDENNIIFSQTSIDTTNYLNDYDQILQKFLFF
jgi:hypothetical protein